MEKNGKEQGSSIFVRPRQASLPKKWVGWFRPSGRPNRNYPLYCSKIKLDSSRLEKSVERKIVLSIPRSCGNAVKRNRFRRMISAHLRENFNSSYFSTLPANKGLWIRLEKRFRLNGKIVTSQWKDRLEAVLPASTS